MSGFRSVPCEEFFSGLQLRQARFRVQGFDSDSAPLLRDKNCHALSVEKIRGVRRPDGRFGTLPEIITYLELQFFTLLPSREILKIGNHRGCADLRVYLPAGHRR